MVANIAARGKHPAGNPMYRYDPAFGMFPGTTFPATTGVGHTPAALGAPHYSGRAGHHMDSHAQQVVSAQVLKHFQYLSIRQKLSRDFFFGSQILIANSSLNKSKIISDLYHFYWFTLDSLYLI